MGLPAIICFRPTNFKEEFRSIQFRDTPIIVQPLDILDKKNGSPPPDSINLLVLCSEKFKDELFYNRCSFCHQLLFTTTGYYLRQEFVKRISRGRRVIVFHKECIEPMVKNPYHPKHSLQVLAYHEDMSSNKRCYCCYFYKQSFRYCSICDFRICPECVHQPPLLTIEHKKRHEHTLSYIFREASMTCDVCGLNDRRHFIYACHQCDFVVHKECIYFPSIIKISRHEHRLAFTSSCLYGKKFWPCGVCRERFNENYGGYLCVKDCSYVVHSKCVVYGDVWDGKELEGEPEDTYEDTTPFKDIGEGIIQHFSHNHYMELQEEIDKANEENNRCQACTLLVYEDDYFSCMECDFILHKVFAYLPMKKQHAMHPHPLVLHDGNTQSKFSCSACLRKCNGFRYECKTCRNHFMLDMRCASVSEPLDHQCHIHSFVSTI